MKSQEKKKTESIVFDFDEKVSQEIEFVLFWVSGMEQQVVVNGPVDKVLLWLAVKYFDKLTNTLQTLCLRHLSVNIIMK